MITIICKFLTYFPHCYYQLFRRKLNLCVSHLHMFLYYLLVSKGPVIFNPGHQSGMNQDFATFSWGMKIFCHIFMG